VANLLAKTGAVVIGRNEGERLRRCLVSLVDQVDVLVYVDSGSSDDSIELAERVAAAVVAIDMSKPFTAARARNAGFKRLRQICPECELVQFVDGDCELVAGWIDQAVAFLGTHDDVAIVCGRRRERYPGRSIYNTLCDIEWNTSIGETKACGGDALMRTDVFDNAGWYRADLIAGEEPELCVRIRAAGWRVWRLDTEMTLHDAAMTRIGQWWRRTQRSGYAFAQGAYLHGAAPERHWVWESRRTWMWSIWFPLACLALGIGFHPWGWIAWLIYPLQLLRQTSRNPGSLRQRALLALFQVLARFPEGLGQLKFMRDRLLGRQQRLIEYK
jgi:glycosyltransferase involved in cell wall biosynthesis